MRLLKLRQDGLRDRIERRKHIAAIFGIGWGLCGVCPGPAIAGLGTGNWALLWALGGIALGALVQGLRAR